MTVPHIDIQLVCNMSTADLIAAWQTLEAACDNSYFTSSGWMLSWLTTLPGDVRPHLLKAHSDAQTLALAVLFRSVQHRHGFVRSRALHLNETGRDDLDCLTIEHNGLLARRDAQALWPHIISYLDRNVRDWDEFYAAGMTGERAAADVPGMRRRLIDTKPVPFAALGQYARNPADFRKNLSQNTRQQLNRAQRRYEQRGPIILEQADSLPQALAFFDEMKDLHQRYWTGRGKPGSFANPYFERFHRHLIENRLAHGEIQLLRLRAGEATTGVLYNFSYRGTVYAYQSGFSYESDNRMKPGLLMHALAIERNIAQGASRYDFLAGDGQHKRSLANATAPMNWLCYQRPRLALRVEAMLRALKNAARRP